VGYKLGDTGFAEGRYPSMPRLNALVVRRAKPRHKSFELFDERGLFLLVNPSGSKIWRFKYKHGGKEKHIRRYETCALHLQL